MPNPNRVVIVAQVSGDMNLRREVHIYRDRGLGVDDSYRYALLNLDPAVVERVVETVVESGELTALSVWL